MDLKSIQEQLKNNQNSNTARDRLNSNFKSNANVTHATRSRSVGPGYRTDSVGRSGRGEKKPIKDAHERFRDRIIHGRDINDVEEELNAVRAKHNKSESVIKMKEEQIIKYKKGLEKAKSILKDMVQSTQEKMKKLQDDVDELQNSLKSKETELRSTTRSLTELQELRKKGGLDSETLAKENQSLRAELEKYRQNQKANANRFSGRQEELLTKNQGLHQTNHRLQQELNMTQSKLQKKLREDQEKTSEIERLHMRIIELEGGNLSSEQARNLTVGRVRRDMLTLESQLANATKMMEDVEFFVSVKNTVDDMLNEAAQSPSGGVENKENIYIPKLKSHPTFETLMETNNIDQLQELSQKLNREVDEDRVNCRRALKELQSKAYILVHSYDEAMNSVALQEKQNTSIVDAFGDMEEMLAKVGENLKSIPVYGDVRDNADSEIPVNRVLDGFRDSSDKPLFVFQSMNAQ